MGGGGWKEAQKLYDRYIHTYMHMYMYVCVYIHRERTHMKYIYIYTYDSNNQVMFLLTSCARKRREKKVVN